MDIAKAVGSALLALGVAAYPATASAVAGGAPIAVSQAPAAVQIFSAQEFGGSCSATKIGERTFLTAAHCLAAGIGAPGEPLAIVQSSDVAGARYREKVTANAVRSAVYGPWSESPDILAQIAADLGIIEIDQDTPRIAIARLPAGPMELRGRLVFLAGYGGDGSAWLEELGPGGSADGSRWSASAVNNVRAFVGLAFEKDIMPGVLLVARAKDVPELGRGVAEGGDSGGGLMLQEDAADPTLVGVLNGSLGADGPVERLLTVLLFRGAHASCARLDRPEVLAWIRAYLR